MPSLSTSPEQAPDAAAPQGSAWRRLLRGAAPRATRANLLAALLALLLGTAIIAQVQLTKQRGLEDLSQTDLVRLLDDVSTRSADLDEQIRELTATRDRLKSGSSEEAVKQAQSRLDSLEILSGTVRAKGPGITLTLDDPSGVVTAPMVLDLVQELRDAGAEAIQVGHVRVVASTAFEDSDKGLLADGKPVGRPVTIKAIGDSRTLSTAMKIPGGSVENLKHEGASASIVENKDTVIDALHTPSAPRYAQPVPDPAPSTTP